uniref:TonB family protein n=1 Tax=Acidicaldus sp. TaxID=1872105 RepID=A0A8J4H9Z6_9PROT
MSSSALQETRVWREASGGLPFLPEGGWRGRFALALALAAALELGLLAYLSGREVILAPEPNNPHPMEVHAVTLPAPLPQLQAVPQVAAPDTAPPPPPPPETTTPPQPMAPPQPEAEVAPPPPAPAEPPPPAAESAFFEPPPPPVVARQPPRAHPVKTARQEAPPPPQPKTEEAKAEPAKPPPPPSAPASAGQNLTALQRYAADLRGRVQSHLEVPATMRGLDLSGDTEVAIALSPDGGLVSVALRKSSGVSAIDRLSLETVKRTGFAPFTPDMPHSGLTFILVVHVTS